MPATPPRHPTCSGAGPHGCRPPAAAAQQGPLASRLQQPRGRRWVAARARTPTGGARPITIQHRRPATGQRAAPPPSPGRRLFVGWVPKLYVETDLEPLFQQVGRWASLPCARPPAALQSRAGQARRAVQSPRRFFFGGGGGGAGWRAGWPADGLRRRDGRSSCASDAAPPQRPAAGNCTARPRRTRRHALRPHKTGCHPPARPPTPAVW